MIHLTTCTAHILDEFGHSLMQKYRSSLHSFEEAARSSVKEIYEEFREPAGQPTFALVRIYRLCQYKQLLPELKALSDPGVPQWMALMGTIGTEKAWCDRHTSQGHKVIPAAGNYSPMLKAAFEQIGFDKMAPVGKEQTDSLAMRDAEMFTSYFYVPNALGSPFIPAQREFVEPYHIRSVVGLGSPFLSSAIYLALCFSLVPIDEATAQKFAELSSYISTLLAIYDEGGTIWAA
ncbi:MAG TPA: hypothetical protein VKQ72_07975 [Aggregatilineales bacterium]|nr:hypothetical protein [Aggregatilineales bacterium]